MAGGLSCGAVFGVLYLVTALATATPTRAVSEPLPRSAALVAASLASLLLCDGIAVCGIPALFAAGRPELSGGVTEAS